MDESWGLVFGHRLILTINTAGQGWVKQNKTETKYFQNNSATPQPHKMRQKANTFPSDSTTPHPHKIRQKPNTPRKTALLHDPRKIRQKPSIPRTAAPLHITPTTNQPLLCPEEVSLLVTCLLAFSSLTCPLSWDGRAARACRVSLGCPSAETSFPLGPWAVWFCGRNAC